MSNNDEYRLLQMAAKFIDIDPGTPGFPERAATNLGGSPAEVAKALDEAFAARQRAGKARVAIAAGEVRVEPTSSRGQMSAGLLAGQDGSLAVGVRIVDAWAASIAGVALRVIDLTSVSVVVTDQAGRASLSATGPGVFVQVGDYRKASDSTGAPGLGVVSLRHPQAQGGYDLAATHEHGASPSEADLGGWRAETGGVAFSYQSRKGGGDLTVLVRDEPAGVVAVTQGAHGVQFDTWGPSGGKRRWIVPLSPGPLGLAGALYGTDEHWLDQDSVQVREVGEFVGELGGAFDEVVGRSVSHADGEAAWRALSRKMDPGRRRAAVVTALDLRRQL